MKSQLDLSVRKSNKTKKRLFRKNLPINADPDLDVILILILIYLPIAPRLGRFSGSRDLPSSIELCLKKLSFFNSTNIVLKVGD